MSYGHDTIRIQSSDGDGVDHDDDDDNNEDDEEEDDDKCETVYIKQCMYIKRMQ